MPLYYFHVRSPSGLEMDRHGLEFDSIEQAVADARRAGAEILLDEAGSREAISLRCGIRDRRRVGKCGGTGSIQRLSRARSERDGCSPRYTT